MQNLAVAERELAESDETIRIEIAPEVVRPSQYFSANLSDASLQPEKRLMLAVLEDAVSDFQRHVVAQSAAGRATFRDAEAWIMREDHEWLFSFVNVCAVLGLDAAYVRTGLVRWRDEQRLRNSGVSPLARNPFRRMSGSRTRATLGAVGVRSEP